MKLISSSLARCLGHVLPNVRIAPRREQTLYTLRR